MLEAESPRNTIVQLETPLKIRVARRKSIEPPTLLRRGEWPNAWDPRMNAIRIYILITYYNILYYI